MMTVGWRKWGDGHQADTTDVQNEAKGLDQQHAMWMYKKAKDY